MSFRSLAEDREHAIASVKIHRKAGKRRSNSAPSIGVSKNKDVNATDSRGRSALFYAAKYGEVGIVRHLLKNGANPNLPDKALNFPLHETVDSGHLEVTEILVQYGCDMNCKNISGETPLMRAMLFDDLDAAKILIKAGAAMNETECTGKTALLIGLQEGHERLCKYLIKAGCDVNSVDELGQSALYFAIKGVSPSISLCQKLFKYGYTADNDLDWLPKDLYNKFSKNGNNFFSRMLRKLGLYKTRIDLDSVEDILSDDYSPVTVSRRL